MSWYRSKLERDLKRWQAAGWVTPDGAGAIRRDLDQSKAAFAAAPVLAVLGAVLFGFAVMSFVAAHWTGMSKLARLALLIGALWACYGGAALLFQRQLAAFAHAAVVGGIAVYGASIMLIAQMYHMEGNPADAVLLWALGALLAAALASSAAALAAGFVLLTIWCAWERIGSESALFGFLLPCAGAALMAAWLRWRPGLHLAALSLALWIVPLGFLVWGGHAHWLVVLIGGVAAVAAVVCGRALDRHLPVSAALFTYGLAVTYAGLFILQFLDDGRWFLGGADSAPLLRLLLLAIFSLALLLGAMVWALNTDNRPALWLAYTAFALEIFTLYVRTFGSLLTTSLFFLVAALIVSGLAWLAYRLHQSKTTTEAAR
ncbi:MAG TPA: DUF2157 domain-containing protein [Hyphomicrobiaceae bacterium]|nr:DUF2157 domain-containing protein [Hyphomicrobiaceae bacterium]